MTKRIKITTNQEAVAYLKSTGADLSYLKGEGDDLFFVERVTCHRCGGAGYYPTPRHGACYECNGRPPNYERKVPVLHIAKKARRKELAAAARERKNAKRDAEFKAAADAKRAEFDATYPGIADALAPYRREFDEIPMLRTPEKSLPILNDFADKLNKWGSLSEKQVAVVERIVAEAAAPKGNVPEGRVEITGTILSAKWRDSNYGNGGAYKMTVKLDSGARVWGTVPAALETIARDAWNDAYNPGEFEAVLKGASVTFTATVSPSDDDPAFGFFKRPTVADKDVSLVWEPPASGLVECEFCSSRRHSSEECPAEAAHARQMEEAHI